MASVSASATFAEMKATCRECGERSFYRDRCPLRHATTNFVLPIDCQTEPEPTDTRDHAEPFNPSPEDEAWYLGVIDHSDWPRDGELSPEEEDAELEHNEWLAGMYEAAFEQDRYEAGIRCW